MTKKLLIIGIVIFLLSLVKNDSLAAGSFRCNADIASGSCKTQIIAACDPNTHTVLPTYQKCEDFDFFRCQTQEFQNPFPCQQGCIPGSKKCDNFDNVITCGADGLSQSVGDCKLSGAKCEPTFNDLTAPPGANGFGAHCIVKQPSPVPSSIPSLTPGGNCLANCLKNNLGGSSACAQLCNPITTPPQGQSGTGNLVVDLNGLIGTLGLPAELTTLTGIVSRALLVMYPLAGILLLLFLIWGGFQYLTSSGDPKKTEAAKSTLTWAILGFIIVVTAFWLTQIVSTIFGLGTTF